MSLRRACVALLACWTLAACQTGARIHEVVGAPLPGSPSDAEVGIAAARAARLLDWEIESAEMGVLHLRKHRGRHSARTQVRYHAGLLSLTLEESVGLEQDAGRIRSVARTPCTGTHRGTRSSGPCARPGNARRTDETCAAPGVPSAARKPACPCTSTTPAVTRRSGSSGTRGVFKSVTPSNTAFLDAHQSVAADRLVNIGTAVDFLKPASGFATD